MNKEDIKKAKNDPLPQKVDRHLSEERQKLFRETLQYRLGEISPKPPLRFVLAFIIVLGLAYCLFAYTDYPMEFIEYLASLYLDK